MKKAISKNNCGFLHRVPVIRRPSSKGSMKMTDEMYHGYLNTPTWVVSAWIYSKEELSKPYEEHAAYLKSIPDLSYAECLKDLAELIESRIRTGFPQLEVGVYRELLDDAINTIDYKEIAATILDND